MIPYKVDVAMYRWPVANVVIIVVTVALFPLRFMYSDAMAAFILNGWNPLGLIGHLVLHGDLEHIFGNMIFLWVFGNAVCSKVGNLLYLVVYVGLGLAAAVAHNVFDGGLAIGASGAINGIVGMFLVFYPLNDVSCFMWIFYPRTFSVSSVWIILLFLVLDVIGAALGLGGIAYFAHLGGFAGGVAVAVLLLKLGIVQMDPADRSLLKIFRLSDGKVGSAVADLPPRGAPATPKQAPRRSAYRSDAPPPIDIKPPAAPPPPAPPPRPRPPQLPPALPELDFIQFQCACGKTLRAKMALIGKQARCPACSAIVDIREP